jgi:hypothetical protein
MIKKFRYPLYDIPGIYQLYTASRNIHGIYMVYTDYIPCRGSRCQYVPVFTSMYHELTKLKQFWNSTSSNCIPCIGAVQPLSYLSWLGLFQFLGESKTWNNLSFWKYVVVCTRASTVTSWYPGLYVRPSILVLRLTEAALNPGRVVPVRTTTG